MTDTDTGSFEQHLRTLEERLAQALERAGLDELVICAGVAPQPVWDDQAWPFRPHPSFLQWCPYGDVHGAALLVRPGSRPRLLLVQPDDFWHAAPVLPNAPWVEAFAIEIVPDIATRDRRIGQSGTAAGIIGAACGNLRTGERARRAEGWLDWHRAVKTAWEIGCIGQANALAATGHRATAARFRAGDVAEFELYHAYMGATRQRAEQLPYPNIVALDAHAAVLHYQRLDDAAVARPATFLIDAGARCHGYAADITRTHLAADSPLSGLRESMETLQQTLCGEAIAGVNFVALNERAHELLAAVLAEHDLIRCSADEALERSITSIFLPHGLGHLLGLQVHDVGGRLPEPFAAATEPPERHPALRLTRTLEPGFVVTIEPGIYFIESLLESLPAELRKLVNERLFRHLLAHGGIRIEDDVAVEHGDNRNLTREAFAATGAD